MNTNEIFGTALLSIRIGDFKEAEKQLKICKGSNNKEISRKAFILLAENIEDYDTFTLAEIEWLKKLQKRGNIFAQTILGYLYFSGKQIPHDLKTSFEFLKLSSNDGEHSAQMFLGYMYEYGIGVKKDFFEAINYYNLSMKNGNVNALGYLSKLVEKMK